MKLPKECDRITRLVELFPERREKVFLRAEHSTAQTSTMGQVCCAKENITPEVANEKNKSKQLTKLMANEQGSDMCVNKLLLLGAGESGKSTLFKQMIKLYGTGFGEAERRAFEPIIYNNIITSMHTLLVAQDAGFGGPVACMDDFKAVQAMKPEDSITEANLVHFHNLWTDPGIQTTYENRSRFQLTDSAKYFFDKIEEVAAENYLPTEQDVLRSRVRTTGIVENSFEIDGNKFKMFDVGGQRNERKKWIHCFENVTAVLFVGVLSEYDLVLYEDEHTNRMEETLTLFDEILNSRWFLQTAMILFLNKRDMFQEKIDKVPLNVCPVFADYEGLNNYEDGVTEIQKEFESKNKDHNKAMYIHTTCATDTNNISAVFNAVKDIVIRTSLGEAGLM